MKHELVPLPDPREIHEIAATPAQLTELARGMHALGQAADRSAAAFIFAEYRARLTPNTVLRHNTDLKVFADFLATAGVVVPVDADEVPVLATQEQAWAGVSSGLVLAFRVWMLQQAYAIGSINVRLSTVRTYARLAHQAGVVSAETWSRIRAISGYRKAEGENIDRSRRAAKHETRVSAKKADPNVLTTDQITQLKQAALTNPTAPAVELAQRDYLLICLLADLGLRCGEAAGLVWGDLDDQLLRVRRPKVKKEQRHRLVGDALSAVRRYRALLHGAGDTPLLARFDKHGNQNGFGLTERALRKRVRQLGKLIGIANLSPHDLRHSWATRLARQGVSVQQLREAGGWSNFDTPSRYVAREDIANATIDLAPDIDSAS